MRIIKLLTLLLLPVAFYSCEEEEIDKLKGKEIPYTILDSGSFSVSEDNTINEQFLVFKTEEDWQVLLSLMEFKSPEKAEEFKEMTFDFENKTLLIITSEFANTCCKEITINEVYRVQGQIYVDFEVDDATGTASGFHQSYVLFEVNKA